MLENKKDKKFGIYYSRFIASWHNNGDDVHLSINDWLESLDLDDEDLRNISEMATCGKGELEVDVMFFVDKMKKEHPDWFED